MINNKLLKILACPVCKSDLSLKDNKLFCKECDTSYGIQNGILKLIPTLNQNNTKKEIIKTNVMNLFDSTEDYDKYSHAKGVVGEYEEYEERKNVMKSLELKKDSLVLDAACGNGRFLKLANNFKIIGLDISLNLLNETRNKGLKNILIQGDLENLPFKDSIFDEVFAIRVLGHLPNIHKAIGEMGRITKTSGRVVIMDYNKYSLFYFRILLKPFFKRLKDISKLSGWNKYYSIGDVEKMLNDVNIKTIIKKHFLFAHLDFFKFKEHKLFVPNFLITPLLNMGKFIDKHGYLIRKLSSRFVVVGKKR